MDTDELLNVLSIGSCQKVQVDVVAAAVGNAQTSDQRN